MSRPMIFTAVESPADGDFIVTDGTATLEIQVSAAQVQAVVGTNAAAGNQLVLTTLANIDKDHDHAAVADPVLYLQSATDPDVDNTQWGSLGFVAATDEFQVLSAGKLRISTTGPELFLGNGVNAADVRVSGGTTSQEARVGLYHGTTPWSVWHTQANIAQSALLVADAAGNQVVIGNSAALGQNYDHGVAPNPTLYIQSDTNPDTNNTQWGSLAHDQTDFVVSSGAGDISLSPASGFLRQVRRVLVSTVPFNASGGTILVGTTQAGDIVTGAWAVVDTAWDGNGTVDLGDADDPDGYLTNATLDKGVLGYKGHEHDTRGALLWDAIGVHDRDKVFSAAGEIRATVVQGTSTFGSMRVFVEVARLLA